MLRRRFEGAIQGLAIGDALGRPTEFINNLDDLHAKFEPQGITDFEPDWHPAGTYTDDTQMSLAVARPDRGRPSAARRTDADHGGGNRGLEPVT